MFFSDEVYIDKIWVLTIVVIIALFTGKHPKMRFVLVSKILYICGFVFSLRCSNYHILELHLQTDLERIAEKSSGRTNWLAGKKKDPSESLRNQFSRILHLLRTLCYRFGC